MGLRVAEERMRIRERAPLEWRAQRLDLFRQFFERGGYLYAPIGGL